MPFAIFFKTASILYFLGTSYCSLSLPSQEKSIPFKILTTISLNSFTNPHTFKSSIKPIILYSIKTSEQITFKYGN